MVTLGLYGFYVSARIYRDTQRALAEVPTLHRPANALPLFMVGSLLFGPLPGTARLQMFEGLMGYEPTTSYLKTLGAQLLLAGWAYQQSRLNALWSDPAFDVEPGAQHDARAA